MEVRKLRVAKLLSFSLSECLLTPPLPTRREKNVYLPSFRRGIFTIEPKRWHRSSSNCLRPWNYNISNSL